MSAKIRNVSADRVASSDIHRQVRRSMRPVIQRTMVLVQVDTVIR